MKVYWTDRAKARLKEIERYIAQDLESAAKKVVKRLLIKSNQTKSLYSLTRAEKCLNIGKTTYEKCW